MCVYICLWWGALKVVVMYGPRKNSAVAVQGRLEGSVQNVCFPGHMSSGNSNKKLSKESCTHLN